MIRIGTALTRRVKMLWRSLAEEAVEPATGEEVVPVRGLRSMKIGEAAVASGASPRALRLYEHEGLIVPGRCSNGYRDYCSGTIGRVRVIRSLLGAGVPVRFVKRALGSLIDGEGDLDSGTRAELAAYHDRLTRRIADLEHQRAALGAFLAESVHPTT